MSVESEAKLLLDLIETITEDQQRGPVDKVEQIHDLLTSPAAAWLAGKTEPEVLAENPYYVLFAYRGGETGYTNEMGSPSLTDVAAAARREIMRGARMAYVTRVVEVVERPK